MEPFAFEVPSRGITNELIEDMKKLAELYDLFKLTGAEELESVEKTTVGEKKAN